ncbi:integrating conjugative element protein [Klebsiella pneumoniae]|uniref:integrating conjugative element protein n=1 Tax=Klebsiella pneumoniae TaxID=573 RepID=UPI0034E94A05
MRALILVLLFFAWVCAAADDYSFRTRGAVDDLLYYQIGGGEAVMPPPVRRSPSPLSVGIGWNADMMCGNFDIGTTVRNQLNGITDGFQQLMGNVIQSATGAVASLPAMIIQRANPQLYDLLTNGVLQGRLDFDKSLLNCQKMAEKMTDLAADSAWFSGAKAENYQTLAASDSDAIRTDQKAAKEAAGWMTRVVGEQTISVAQATDDPDARSGAQAGIGLHPLIDEEKAKILLVLTALVNGNQKPGFDNLAKASGGSMQLTRGVVEALRDDPDAAVLTERLAGELALARVTEQALLARRTLLAGMREPNIANVKEAQESLGKTTIQLDEELSQLKLELDFRQALTRNTASQILQRKQQRDQLQGQAVEVPDDSDRRLHNLNNP